MPPQSMSLWRKNYFKLKAFEFLKSLICLKAEFPKRTQLSYVPFQRGALISSWRQKHAPSNRQCHRTITSPIYPAPGPFIFQKSRVLLEVPLHTSPSPIMMVQ